MPPKLSARQLLWAGLILTAVGVFVGQYLFLTRDLWNFLGFPLTAVAVPLGIALVPCAFVVRMLESRVSDPQGVSAEASHP